MFQYDWLLNKRQPQRKYAIRARRADDWYFKDKHESVPFGAIWVPRLRTAWIFTEEEDVEDFKATYLKGRPCDIIYVD